MLRFVGVQFQHIEEFGNIENTLRGYNDSARDRQVRVKLEAYHSKHHMDKSIIRVPEVTQKKESSKRDISQENSEIDELLSKKAKVESNGVVSSIPIRKWTGQHPKKTLFKNLIMTLNLAFTNYDFNSVKIDQFRRTDLKNVTQIVTRHFFELMDSPNVDNFLSTEIWKSIEGVVGHPLLNSETNEIVTKTLEPTEIYCYVPEGDPNIDGDPLASLGNLWAFNFFFCNPTLGKIVLFACSCRQRKFSQVGEFELEAQNSFYEAWEESDHDEVSADNPDLVAVTTSLEESTVGMAF